jgi:hypothetical protein
VEESLEAAAEQLGVHRLEIAGAIAKKAMQDESEEESEEEEESAEEEEPPARRRRTEARNVPLRRSPRGAAMAQPPAPAGRQNRQEAPAPAAERGRGAIMPPIQLAGALRAPGLGSRREAAQNLFTLAADLTRSGEGARAAAASAGGLVILELLDKVG